MATDRVKAIETRYAGHRFRSRLEARWAVFFDRLNVPWVYEPQGYVVDGAPYLPDFWLPSIGIWCEVKGAINDAVIHSTMNASAVLPRGPHSTDTGGVGILLLGPIPSYSGSEYSVVFKVFDGVEGGVGWRWHFFVTRAHECGGVNTALVPIGWRSSKTDPEWSAETDWLTPRAETEEALMAARQARFEHGESG